MKMNGRWLVAGRVASIAAFIGYLIFVVAATKVLENINSFFSVTTAFILIEVATGIIVLALWNSISGTKLPKTKIPMRRKVFERNFHLTSVYGRTAYTNY